jgi:DNA polymerase phi
MVSFSLILETYAKKSRIENLFSATASSERKYWGFLLFEKVIENASAFAKVIPSVFSRNLVRCIINHVKDKDRFLNRMAEKALKKVVQAVHNDAKILPVILPCLISGHGAYNFDRNTKTKTVEQLLRMVDDGNASKVIKILKEPTVIIQG